MAELTTRSAVDQTDGHVTPDDTAPAAGRSGAAGAPTAARGAMRVRLAPGSAMGDEPAMTVAPSPDDQVTVEQDGASPVRTQRHAVVDGRTSDVWPAAP